MRLGEDILLARHGDCIVELRHIRKADVMVARLRDGSTDWAPNTLNNMNVMSSTAPVARMNKMADAFTEGKLPVSRAEVKFLVKVSLVWSAVAVVLTGGMMMLAMNIGDPELAHLLIGAGI